MKGILLMMQQTLQAREKICKLTANIDNLKSSRLAPFEFFFFLFVHRDLSSRYCKEGNIAVVLLNNQQRWLLIAIGSKQADFEKILLARDIANISSVLSLNNQ